jgi:hypothetical protein
VGAHALRRYLLEQAWRHYLEVIPEILKNLSSKKNSVMAVRVPPITRPRNESARG